MPPDKQTGLSQSKTTGGGKKRIQNYVNDSLINKGDNY